ncbi:MAG: penicillin-binding protein 2 [Myxococcota bacterium]
MVGLGLGGERQYGKFRYRVMLGVVAAALSILIIRLYVLQVLRHEEFRQKSESNFVQLRRIPHDRGIMKDREGRVLVDNRPSHDVFVTPAFLPDSRHTLGRILRAAGSDRPLRQVNEDLIAALKNPHPPPYVLVPSVPEERLAEVSSTLHTLALPGVDLREAEGQGSVVVYPLEFPSTPLVFRRLAEILGLGEGGLVDTQKEALRAKGLNRFVPILVKQNVPWEVYARVEHAASLGELPGADVVASVVRRYREGSLASHTLGYMNEVSSTELQVLAELGYQRGDYLGRRGLERTFEKVLRGVDGQEKVVVDAKGRRLPEDKARLLLGEDRRVEAKPGNTLVLSLDMDLQRAAESAFRGRAGAVVAVEVATGSILALASFPTYDPNIVSARMTAADKRALDSDPLQPWINKAIQNHYSPGSTFKILTAIAGLKEGKITPETHLPCPGFFSLGRTQWRCFNRAGHGGIALQKSVTVSCDSYYYRLGYTLGANALAETARAFGLGRRTGIPLDGEIPGIMPDEQYYKDRFGSYQGGYVVNNAIGQGDVNVTPLQLAMAFAAVVNGGILYEPRLVLRREDANGNVVQEFPPRERARQEIPQRGLETIMAGMADVVKPGGTASGVMYKDDPPGLGEWLRTSGISIAGKTGTAQVARLSKSVAHVDAEKMEYWVRDHAWFAGYAPADKPEIVVVTLTEHGGFGGSVSAPVSASVMRAYFEKKGFHSRPQTAAKDVGRKTPVPVNVVPQQSEPSE